MKRCIWCSKTENHTKFDKKAHTIPQSLGGKHICENVCDACNEYFGNKEFGKPAIEVALKEVLNISKYLILSQHKEIKLPKFKSEYFIFNYKNNNRLFKFKMGYKLKHNFQNEFGRRFRRGLFKVYLEERERQIGDANDDRFNFIREFARYNFNNYPIYIKKPKFPGIVYNIHDLLSPQIRFTEYSEEIDRKYRYYDYPLMGHYFVIPTSNQFMQERFNSYENYLIRKNDAIGTQLILVDNIENIDFRFEFMSDKK